MCIRDRPVTAACNNTDPQNPLLRSNALDLIGFNYNHSDYTDFPELFPSSRLIATETVSSLHTRGSYHMPSDKIRRWPKRWDIPFTDGHPELTCSAYDNSSTPWGSTHKETWDAVKNSDHVSGMFIWTGFDYLGEPTPYSWPARSSYFGLIDLAGFPKDAYYFYQSEWSAQDVLHIFPHWNWEEGQEIDLWAYTNCTEVELFLNNESMGVKAKSENDSYLVWKLKYTPGMLKAVGKTRDDEIIAKEIYTASEPYQINLTPDREFIDGDGRDLSFVKVSIHDKAGNLVPYADNLVEFSIEGVGSIVGVDNGLQTSLESFKSNSRKAFNGLCLAIIQARDAIGKIDLTARSEGILEASVSIYTK
jgi:beta-galactosidase